MKFNKYTVYIFWMDSRSDDRAIVSGNLSQLDILQGKKERLLSMSSLEEIMCLYFNVKIVMYGF